MTEFSFYLNNLSFQQPEGLTLEVLRDKIEQLSEDCEFIREHEEKIYRHESIYEECIFEEMTISDMLYVPEFIETIGRDYQFQLAAIIDHSTETEYDNELIIEFLEEHSEQEVNGLLCLHEVMEIKPVYCVYNKNNWLDFHRYFLGFYPIDETYFGECCTKYFPELAFHPEISTTLKTLEGKGLPHFSKTVVKCLSHLNDDFKNCLDTSNIPGSLKTFSTFCGIETSNEGDANRKKDLTFSFLDKNGKEKEIYCEPHMKVSSSDEGGDSKYYHNRIYFYPGVEDVAEGKVLVAHIGKHL